MMNQNECMGCGEPFESEGLENFCPACETDQEEAYEYWADAVGIPE